MNVFQSQSGLCRKPLRKDTRPSFLKDVETNLDQVKERSPDGMRDFEDTHSYAIGMRSDSYTPRSNHSLIWVNYQHDQHKV